MSPERLLQHFDQISEAPDAVPRLRRFILDLAVRGKLAEQDPMDEPAGELLKKIKAEKARLVKDGQIKKDKPIQLIEEEQPCPLPTGWEWTALGNTGRIFNGNSVSESGKNDLSKISDGLPFIATKDVGYGRDSLIYENGLRVPLNAGDFKVAHTNAVLICAEGGSAGKKIGLADRDICFGNKLYANELLSGIHPRYILSLYQAPSFYAQFSSKMTGIIGGIARSEFLTLPVPMPPEQEQHRIVAKVDELMKLCDELEAVQAKRERRRDRLLTATLHGLNNGETNAEISESLNFEESARFYFNHIPRFTTHPEHIQQLRQTILNLAVRGKLVPQDLKDEAVISLLNRIATEQCSSIKDGNLKKQTESVKLNDALHSIPPEWKWVSLAALIVFGPQNGVSPKKTNNEKTPKALTLTATTSGYFDRTQFKHVELSKADSDNYWLSSGDILFQRGNTREYVGIAAIYDGPEREFVFPDLMIRVRFSKSLDLRFIHMTLISPSLRFYFSTQATGASSTMPKINQGVVLRTPIPLPPLAEQYRIVAKVDELMKLCDELETKITTTTSTRRRLLESTLKESLAV